MADLSKAELKALAETQAGPCVSIYMPTHPGGDSQQDPIRLKNLMGDAEKKLAANGLRVGDVRRLMAPADALVPRHNFWMREGEGLAVFLAPDFFRYYRLPFPVEELVVTGQRFHLKPLLSLLAPDGHFLILALSQNRVRLLEGTRRTVNEVDVAGLPQGLAEALAYDEREPHLQWHTGSRTPGGRGGERPAVYHGQGVGEQDEKSDILRYFHQIDHALRDWLGSSQAPLVLAGVEYLLPLYREANSYPHLVETGIKGNPEDLRPAELHSQAWEIVRPIFITKRENMAALFRRLSGAGDPLGSTDLKEIVPAAHYGRVEALFVQLGKRQWGKFDADAAAVELHDEAAADDVDLMDLAAVQTYLNSGQVYAVTADKMPSEAPIAAVFRY